MADRQYLPERCSSYDELQNIFSAFNIDSEKTRFYIGKDYTEPKAFVIYQDDFGDFVVYKMKADGSRALRYKGPDEQYAVNEFYQKFLDEVRKRPEYASKLFPVDNAQDAISYGKIDYEDRISIEDFIGPLMSIITFFVIAFVVARTFIPLIREVSELITYKQGYYYHNGTRHKYYHRHSDWYQWDDVNDIWYYIDYIPEYDIYSQLPSEEIYIDEGFYPFEDSEFYQEYTNDTYSNDYDYDWDWGSGWDDDSDSWDSWDSDDTDWDSDW